MPALFFLFWQGSGHVKNESLCKQYAVHSLKKETPLP